MLGLPNLSLLLVMACFWLVFVLVNSQLVKPLGALLDERAKRLREGKDEFAAAQQSLAETLSRCERELAVASSEAQRERAAARAAGEAARRTKLDAARQQGQARLNRLKLDLERAADHAREDLQARSRELAAVLAERLAGRKLTR